MRSGTRARKLWRVVGPLAIFATLAAGCAGGEGDAADELAASADEEGETFQLTVGSGHTPPVPTSIKWVDEFLLPEIERRVSEETAHTVEFRRAFSGTVVGFNEVLSGTESGLIDIGHFANPYESSNLPLHNLGFYVPFQSPDVGVVMQAMRDTYEKNPELGAVFEEEFGQRVIARWGISNYGLVSTFEWDDLSDLDGVQVGAVGPNLDWLDSTGAVPVQSDISEWYTSLQTGVFEAAIVFLESVPGLNLHEVAPYYAEIDFGAMPIGTLTINNQTWDDLPDDVRSIISEVAAEFEETLPEQVREVEERALDIMTEEGATVLEISDEARSDWANRLPNLAAQRAEEAEGRGLPGKKAIEDYIASQEEQGHTFPRRWDVDG